MNFRILTQFGKMASLLQNALVKSLPNRADRQSQEYINRGGDAREKVSAVSNEGQLNN